MVRSKKKSLKKFLKIQVFSKSQINTDFLFNTVNYSIIHYVNSIILSLLENRITPNSYFMSLG